MRFPTGTILLPRRRALAGLAGLAAAAALGRPAAAAIPASDPDVARVQAYLQALTTVTARFIQVGPEGEVAQGQVWLQRPGRLRFEYQEPPGLLLVGDGLLLRLYDPTVNQLTDIPIASSPASILLDEEIDLGGAVEVLDVYARDGVLEMTVASRNEPGAGTLTVVFTQEPFELRQWYVQDAQGLTTRVTLLEAQYGLKIDQKLFVLENMPQPGENR